MRKKSGFTLVELLIVIAILAVLAVVVVLVINPVELLREAHDAQILSDLGTLNSAVAATQADGLSLGSSTVVYVSIPDSSPTCTDLGLPALTAGWSYACASNANYRKTDSTGWIPVAFSNSSAGAPFALLPVDPINTTSSGNYYTYATDANGHWEITAAFESKKYEGQETGSLVNGIPGTYAAGNNVTLSPIFDAMNLVGYWPMEEGSGTVTHDLSGNGNTGNLLGGPLWVVGKVGDALSFSGGNNVITSGNTNLGSTAYTIAAWVRPNNFPSGESGVAGTGAPSYPYDIAGLAIDSNQHVHFFYGRDGNGAQDVQGVGTVPQGAWSYIAATYDGQHVSIYINGSLDSTAAATISQSPANAPFSIGIISDHSSEEGFNNFNGSVDEVRAYSRVLPASEIQGIYNFEK